MSNRINSIFVFSFAHFTEKISLGPIEFRLEDFIHLSIHVISPHMEFE
jgi:hypothetical protein